MKHSLWRTSRKSDIYLEGFAVYFNVLLINLNQHSAATVNRRSYKGTTRGFLFGIVLVFVWGQSLKNVRKTDLKNLKVACEVPQQKPCRIIGES